MIFLQIFVGEFLEYIIHFSEEVQTTEMWSLLGQLHRKLSEPTHYYVLSFCSFAFSPVNTSQIAQVSPNKKFSRSLPPLGETYGGCDIKRSLAVGKDKLAFHRES